jgi:hypothetical protein
MFQSHSSLGVDRVAVGTTPSSDARLRIAAGDASVAPLWIMPGANTTNVVPGQIMVNNAMYVDVSGSLRGNGKINIYTQTADVTVTDLAVDPNPETSLFTSGTGTHIFPANSITVDRVIGVKMMGVISTVATKTAAIKVYIGANSITDSITYADTATSVYWELDLDVKCTLIAGTVGTMQVMGKSIFGTGASGAHPAMRYLRGTISVADVTASNTLNVTFQWGDPNRNIANTITAEVSEVTIDH